MTTCRRDRVYVARVEDELSFTPVYRNERVAFDRILRDE